MSDKSFLKPPKIVGGADVAVEYCDGVCFRVDDIGFPQWRMNEVSVIRIRGGTITLRGSRS